MPDLVLTNKKWICLKPLSHSPADLTRARQEKALADSVRLQKHAIIYMKIKNGEGDELIKVAKQQISLWKKNDLCSAFYQEIWERALGDYSIFESVILNPKNHHLRQNTPFLLDEF